MRPAGARQLRQQRRLKRLIVHRRVRFKPLLVVPIAAGRQGLRFIAGHQPRLRHMPQRQIVGRVRAAHFGRHPTGIDRAADHVRPQARHGGGQRGDEQLAVRIRTASAAKPIHAVQFRHAVKMHAAAQVDDTLGAFDQGRQQVGRHDVHRHHLQPGKHAGIVDHRVRAAEAIDLLGKLPDLLHIGQIADRRLRAPIQQIAHRGQTARLTRMQDHLMPFVQQRLRGGAAQPVDRAGNENA